MNTVSINGLTYSVPDNTAIAIVNGEVRLTPPPASPKTSSPDRCGSNPASGYGAGFNQNSGIGSTKASASAGAGAGGSCGLNMGFAGSPPLPLPGNTKLPETLPAAGLVFKLPPGITPVFRLNGCFISEFKANGNVNLETSKETVIADTTVVGNLAVNGNIRGDAKAGGNINCGKVGGSVIADGNISVVEYNIPESAAAADSNKTTPGSNGKPAQVGSTSAMERVFGPGGVMEEIFGPASLMTSLLGDGGSGFKTSTNTYTRTEKKSGEDTPGTPATPATPPKATNPTGGYGPFGAKKSGFGLFGPKKSA